MVSPDAPRLIRALRPVATDTDAMSRHRKSLDPRLRVPVAIAAAVQVALTVATLVDLRRRDADQVKGPKKVWAAAAFVNFVGPIAYFVFGRRR